MEIFDSPTPVANLDELVKIPDSLSVEYEKRRRNSLVGSYEHIKQEFHRMPITEGWATYSYTLKKSGAIVAVKYKTPMVNTDIISKELAPFVLEHEIVESTLDADPSENHNGIALDILSSLDLIDSVKVSRPRWNHALAVVFQLRMAQKEGLLEEMMKFADDLEARDENRISALGNKQFREAVSAMLEKNPIGVEVPNEVY